MVWGRPPPPKKRGGTPSGGEARPPPGTPTQPGEPNLFPKFRFHFADFLCLHFPAWPEPAKLGHLLRILVRPETDMLRRGAKPARGLQPKEKTPPSPAPAFQGPRFTLAAKQSSRRSARERRGRRRAARPETVGRLCRPFAKLLAVKAFHWLPSPGGARRRPQTPKKDRQRARKTRVGVNRGVAGLNRFRRRVEAERGAEAPAPARRRALRQEY